MKLKAKACFYKLKKSIACLKKDRKSFGLTYSIWHKRNKRICEKLKKYKGIHDGQKCFIIGTGPSFSIDDILKLGDITCFGVNTLYKIYEKINWRATYYCVIDPSTYSAIGKYVKKYHKDTLFIAGNRIDEKDSEINKFALNCSSFFRLEYKDYFGATDFSDDISNQIFDGASVVYAALQIAVFMGFKDIYLLGVDCNYDNNIVLHGDSLDYNSEYKYNWTKQTGLTMIECFKVAKEYAEKHNINIYNATRGGMLEVFPRVDLDDVIMEDRIC